eukprot:s2863_g4.t1
MALRLDVARMSPPGIPCARVSRLPGLPARWAHESPEAKARVYAVMPSAIFSVAGLAGKWRLERRLQSSRRSRGGEAEGGARPAGPGEASEDGDFLAGFRAALGSREESLHQELRAVREQLSNAEKRISEVETAKETLIDQLRQAREEVMTAIHSTTGEEPIPCFMRLPNLA